MLVMPSIVKCQSADLCNTTIGYNIMFKSLSIIYGPIHLHVGTRKRTRGPDFDTLLGKFVKYSTTVICWPGQACFDSCVGVCDELTNVHHSHFSKQIKAKFPLKEQSILSKECLVL